MKMKHGIWLYIRRLTGQRETIGNLFTKVNLHPVIALAL